MSAKMPIVVDNFLKILIAVLVSVLIYVGTELKDSVRTMEEEVSNIKISMAEMKADIKYLTANGRQAAK